MWRAPEPGSSRASRAVPAAGRPVGRATEVLEHANHPFDPSPRSLIVLLRRRLLRERGVRAAAAPPIGETGGSAPIGAPPADARARQGRQRTAATPSRPVDDAKIIRTGTMTSRSATSRRASSAARDAILAMGGYVGA